jgi:N-acetylglucosamine repressor
MTAIQGGVGMPTEANAEHAAHPHIPSTAQTKVNFIAGTHQSASHINDPESNRSHILWHLYHHGVSSRAQIAKALGLTPAAITKITAHLIDTGVIGETGDIQGSKRRRSIGLELKSQDFHVMGIKFARSLVQVGIFDLKGTCLTLTTLPPVDDDHIERTIGTIHRYIDDSFARDHRIAAIGMAVPGPYLKDEGRAALISSMPHWRNINFREEFASSSPVPVFIEQDARAGALAQRLFGGHEATDCLAYFLLGEGVGLGVIENGKLVCGTLGAATEIGHVSIDTEHGLPCECGNVGCLERYCSAGAIHERINKLGLIDHSEQMGHAEACDALFTMCGQNTEARKLVQDIGRYVGYGCVTICNAFNPSRIVLGDIATHGGHLLLESAQEVVDQRVVPEIAHSTQITVSNLSTDAAVLGAAATAITKFLDHPSWFFDNDTSKPKRGGRTKKADSITSSRINTKTTRF